MPGKAIAFDPELVDDLVRVYEKNPGTLLDSGMELMVRIELVVDIVRTHKKK